MRRFNVTANVIVSSLLFCFAAALPAYAQEQEAPVAPPQDSATEAQAPAAQDPAAQKPEVMGAMMPLSSEFMTIPSIMFPESDIKNLSKVVVALRLKAEQKKEVVGEGVSEQDVLDELLRRSNDQQAEIQPMPEFYLSSILYRSPSDWSIWLQVKRDAPPSAAAKQQEDSQASSQVQAIVDNVNSLQNDVAAASEDSKAAVVPIASQVNARIMLSSKEPENDEFGIRVESISKHAVSLIFTPIDVEVAKDRYSRREEDSQRKWDFRNRLVAGSPLVFDEVIGVFKADLKPNQTLSFDLMQVVEGKAFSTKPAPTAAQKSAAEGGSAGDAQNSAVNATGVDRERAISDALINNMQKIQQFVPVPQDQLPNATSAPQAQPQPQPQSSP